MSRISALFTKVMIQSGPAGTGEAITAATKAKPCVLTVTGTTVQPGDVVVPKGTGFFSLDGIAYVVKSVLTGAVTLADSDTTRETGTVPATGATLEKPTMVEIPRSNINVNQPASPTIDVTTLADPAHRVVSALPALATWQGNGFWDKDDASIDVARGYQRTGEFVAFKVEYSDGSGLAFRANVNQFDAVAGVNQAVTANMGGQVDGPVNKF